MNKNEIVSMMNTKLSILGFKLKKHSPEILVISGVVGVVASAVMACRATTKVGEIVEKAKDDIDIIRGAVEGNIPTKEPYTEDDAKRDITITYTKMGLKLVKLYAPAVVIGGLSITAILYSNGILRKRNMALAAAYATVDGSFKDYRNRVIDRFGEEVEKELRYNIKPVTVEEKTIDENGNEVTTEKTLQIAEPSEHNMYTKIFDETSCYWNKNPEYNLMFLNSREAYANNKLNTQGYLFLNDVLEMLDIPKTKEGQIVGWVKNPKNGGDGYVDFGIFNANKRANREFINGYEPSIWLEFNVDGNILDLM